MEEEHKKLLVGQTAKRTLTHLSKVIYALNMIVKLVMKLIIISCLKIVILTRFPFITSHIFVTLRMTIK